MVFSALLLCLAAALGLSGCRQAVSVPRTETKESSLSEAKTVTAPASVPAWLGNPARNFYGTGPWPSRPLQVIWEFQTKSTSGPLHQAAWGGAGWPGQASVTTERAYFGSADGYVYCLSTKDGSLIW
ncbi:MAG TPA: PQQ-binding-like beta-propeller repeat protein, partial [Pyrinomonadaceae bacterium]|nr:PQQ-binding-like beta-propeller repeat protein [Pyrinomonadaceae bacterium]